MKLKVAKEQNIKMQNKKAILESFHSKDFFTNIILDKNFNVVAFNQRANNKFSYQLDLKLSVGSYFIDYLPQALKNETINDLEKAFSGVEVTKITYLENVFEPCWIKYIYSPIQNTDSENTDYVDIHIFSYNTSPNDNNFQDISHILLTRKIFEFSSDATLIVKSIDLNNITFVDCNPRALELLGFKNMFHLQDNWNTFKLLPLDSSQIEKVNSILQSEGIYQEEIVYTPFQGKPFHCIICISSFNFENKDYQIIKFTDLTILKEKEEKLREQEELFRYITKATQDGIYRYDLVNNSTWVSAEYLKMIGYEDEAKFHHIEWFINKVHPEDKEYVKENLEKLRIGNVTNMKLEYRFLHKNGQYLYFIDRGFIIRDAKGKVSQIIGAMTDVTILREKEEFIAESEKKLLNILNTVQETVFSFSYISKEKPKFNFFSKPDKTTWGYSKEELIGEKSYWYNKIVKKDKINIVNPALKRLKKLESVEIEYHFVLPNGNIRCIYSRLSPKKINDQEYLIIGTAIDITEKKNIEEQLKTQNEELKKTNMELDRFVYSTSHDLRAPLTSVLGLINLFSTETEDPVHQQYLSMIKTSITRLDKFITNIVDYSRNSRTKVVKEVVDFTEMIDESFDQLKFMDGYENIKRTLKIDSQIHLVTDKTRLQMILNNLISNSIKYRKRNEKECIISVEVIKDMDQMVNLKISDNGMGIAKDNLDKIFEMFFTGNTENHGSGIGLYIVKESIEKLQGKIDVASELNKGTTFTIKLPENSI